MRRNSADSFIQADQRNNFKVGCNMQQIHNISNPEPYYIIDSENQEDKQNYKKQHQSNKIYSPKKLSLNPQRKNLDQKILIINQFKSQNANAPYVDIRQIIQLKKMKDIRNKYYQNQQPKQNTLQSTLHQKLLKKAIQSAQKECQMIEKMISSLLQEEILIQRQLQEAHKRKRMLSRLTPQIYEMEKSLQTAINIKLNIYSKQRNTLQYSQDQNRLSKPLKSYNQTNNLKKTVNIKRNILSDQSLNQIRTNPNSPRSKGKNLTKAQKSDGTTVRKKFKQIKQKQYITKKEKNKRSMQCQNKVKY